MASTTMTALFLTVEKGPRAGETIHRNPASCRTTAVRIGRVIKGNNFTIKDPTISQKHLEIEHDGRSGWVVTDLETSNGTFLNNAAIEPLVPTPLKDGDLLKIGENSTIAVRIGKTESTSAKDEVVGVPKARVERSRKYETRSGALEATGPDPRAGKEKNKNAGGDRPRGRARARVASAAEPTVEAEVPATEKSEAGDADQTGKADVGVEPMNDAAVGGAAGVVDLERMTVGEWLDSVEKYLPMVIKDTADEMIADLRERAGRFNEFVSERARQQASSRAASDQH